MKSTTSPSIIMRTMEFGESDLLVTFFSVKQGRLKGIAKGARKSRKRFVNALDIFSHAEVEYSPGRNGGLHFLHSSRLIDSYPGIRNNYRLLGVASFMVELTEILFPWELAEKRMFETLKSSFKDLATGKAPEIVAVIFEIRAMSLGGFGMNLEKCCSCGRRYKSEGTAVFISPKGGIACTRCEKVTSITPGMDPETVITLNRFQSDFKGLSEYKDISHGIIRKIQPVLRLHREYQLGRRLKTAKYLEHN